jgi:5'-3' exonuclease
VLAWDGRLDHKRRIYPEYKQRKAKADRTPDEALESERREAAMQLAQNTAPLIGMRSACPDIGEADDIAGLIVGMATDLGVRRVCLVTDDRDVLQLIRAPSRSAPEVCVYRPGKDEIVDLAAFRSRYGFDPRRFPDYKSLVGEPATGDNIPGVPGIGDVRAGALVAEHGTLSAIIAACEQRCAAPKPKAYERAIVAHANDARLSLVLSHLPDNQSRFIKTWFAADPDPALAMIARLRLAVTGDHGPSKGDIVNRLRSLGFGSDAIRVACDLAQDSAAAHRRFVSHGSVR